MFTLETKKDKKETSRRAIESESGGRQTTAFSFKNK